MDHWDSGVNTGNSIGTNSAVEFDVAARWEPAQLAVYEGASVTQVTFVPSEAQCTYNIRIWVGAGAANLVVDQPVSNRGDRPVERSDADHPCTGRHYPGIMGRLLCQCPDGLPGRMRRRPTSRWLWQHDGNFGGWQTLLQINPELTFNWNIAAHLVTVTGVTMPLSKSIAPYETPAVSFAANPSPDQVVREFSAGNGSRELTGYNIYRNADGGEYMMLDYTTETTYLDTDDDLISGTYYCYMVSAVWASESDMCESAFSNEDCELWGTSITDPNATTGSFSLYPNPADDHVFIATTEDLKRVTVYNALGQLVTDEITTGKQYELTTSGYTIGVYMIRVETSAV